MMALVGGLFWVSKNHNSHKQQNHVTNFWDHRFYDIMQYKGFCFDVSKRLKVADDHTSDDDAIDEVFAFYKLRETENLAQ